MLGYYDFINLLSTFLMLSVNFCTHPHRLVINNSWTGNSLDHSLNTNGQVVFFAIR